MNGLKLARKLLRVGYYWLDMEKDALKYAKTCQKCQLHGNLIHAPERELIPFLTHWLFQQWAFDLVGQIYPTSSNGHNSSLLLLSTSQSGSKWFHSSKQLGNK